MKNTIRNHADATEIVARWAKSLFCLICAWTLICPGTAIMAQSNKKLSVTGKIVDSAGNPVAGVTVMEKNTYNGTYSLAGGEYQLRLLSQETILVYSFIGYKTLERRVQAGTVVDVVLENSDIVIEEVVKVAYGVQKRESITGAIASVGAKDLVKSSSANIMNALSGRIAGLTALQSGGGQPGYDNAVFYLRGIGTTDASRSTPLIMIDGVPRDNMSNLDPNEIESVSVLKDASSTAVFGVRGANGVILITTKRGKVGKPQLSITFNQSYSGFTKRPKRLHSLEYLELRNQATENSGTQGGFDPSYIDMFKNPLQGLNPGDPNYAQLAETRKYMYPDHDAYSDYIKKWAPQTRVNANISGGIAKLGYFINVGYVHQGSNLKNEPESKLGYDPEMKMDRWSFRSNLDYQFSKSFKAFLNVASYIESFNMPDLNIHGSREGFVQTILRGVNSRLPITPGYVTLPGYGVEAGITVKEPYYDWPPYYLINRTGYREDNNTNLNSTLGAEWDLSGIITKGLSIKGQISYDNYGGTLLNGSRSERLYEVSVNPDTDILQYIENDRYNDKRLTLTRSHRTRYTINAQASLNYERTFGKHNVSALLLAQRDYWESEGAAIPYNVIGLVGRVTYNYDTKYFAEFNMGYNGSEQFAPGNRFGFFPAVSVGWVMTNEKFLADNNTLNYLKIRASAGQVGNDKIGNDRFLYLDNITVGSGGVLALGSLGKGQYVFESYIGNDALQWEVATKLNIGVDFELFRGLRGTIDVFSENRDKILITRQSVPYFQGVPQGAIPKVNMGKVKNKGYEIELNYNRELAKDFRGGLRANMSYNKNEITFYDEITKDGTYMMKYDRTGYAVDQQKGYLIDWDSNGGFWTSEEEIANSGLSYDFGTPHPGDFKYKDLNGDQVINEKDIVPIGYSSSIPRYNYGFGLDLSWKGLDFSIFFQGVSKYSNNYGAAVWETNGEGSYWEYTRQAWTPSRWANGEKITYPALSTEQGVNHVSNDFYIMDRSFIRLKNLEVGYTLPKKWLSKVGVEQFRIYVSGQNLCIWDNIRANHVDPEMNNANDYPITRMISFGCNLNF